jgi:acetyl-CoA carboxylase biotin carboxyl carrier protein
MSNEISNDDIKDYVRLAVDFDIAEIEVSRGDQHVKIRRKPDAPVQVQHIQPPFVPGFATVADGVAPANSGQSGAPAANVGPAANDMIVKSPIVGTYYDQAKPGDAPFVKVGDVVEPGHVLCIIESMKLMNEIESELSGTIVAKLMENGRPVEYGEALFTIRPR